MSESQISVRVDNLTVKFQKFTAVDRVSFTVNRSEIFGFLGANGAGKTTTIRVLCGLLLPTEGNVEVAGVGQKQGLDAMKTKVGYMSQKFTLYNDLTVSENLAFTASLRKIPNNIFRARTKELLEFIGFDQSLATIVRDLPGGIKQQVSLVASILHDPEVVFLDEPTAGVTPAARARFWGLIRKLATAGKTMFVTTHYMDEAEQCGRVALMRAGRIIALDSPEGLKRSTFPEPLFEIEPPSSAPSNWLERVRSELSVAEIQPYGLRYHVRIRDLAGWEAFVLLALTGFRSRRIQPTLEDVFIRQVEGAGR